MALVEGPAGTGSSAVPEVRATHRPVVKSRSAAMGRLEEPRLRRTAVQSLRDQCHLKGPLLSMHVRGLDSLLSCPVTASSRFWSLGRGCSCLSCLVAGSSCLHSMHKVASLPFLTTVEELE